jgi:hypothetical protein
MTATRPPEPRYCLTVDLVTASGTAVTDLVEFDDRGHSLTIDHDRRAVADECLSWLAKQEL